MLECARWGQGQEGVIVNELTVGEAQFAEGLSLGQEVGDRRVADEAALVEVDLEDVGAVLGEGQDGLVVELDAIVQLER